MHVEGTLLGLLDRPCSPSPLSDQNFKMTDDEEDCSGKIYARYEQRNVGEVKKLRYAVNQVRSPQPAFMLQERKTTS